MNSVSDGWYMKIYMVYLFISIYADFNKIKTPLDRYYINNNIIQIAFLELIIY